MAIQPIDLQILFAQIDKVGKIQVDQKDGAQIQQSVQSAIMQRKVDEMTRSVNETKDSGEGAERVKDGQSGAGRDRQGKQKEKDESEAEETKSEVITDPGLGRNVDISG